MNKILNNIFLKLSIVCCSIGLSINLLSILETNRLERKVQTLEFERTLGIAKPITQEQLFSELAQMTQKFALYTQISRISIFILIILIVLIIYKLSKTNNINEIKNANNLLLIFSAIIGLLKEYFVRTSFMKYTFIILLILAILTNIMEIINKNKLSNK